MLDAKSLRASLRRSSGSDAKEQAHFGGDDIGWQALGPAIGCVCLATIVVSSRWFARWRLAKCEGPDDYIILLSLILSWTMTALIAVEVNGGNGIFAGPVEIHTVVKLLIASNCLWILIVNITKASILIQYLRVFSGPLFRSLCYTFLFLLVPAACWAVFGGILLCSPAPKLWEPELPGQCISTEIYWLSVAGNDIGLDFLILLLPLPAITRLRLPRRQKIGLIVVFTLGFFVCLVSVARLLTVLLASKAGDYIQSGVWAIVWSAVEANVGIICASFVSLKPLFVKLFPAVLEETRPPSHSMRLALVDESLDGRWHERVKAHARSMSSLTRPSTSWSWSNKSAVRKSSLGCWPSHGDEPPSCPHGRQDGQMSFLDMLREANAETRINTVLRRTSCFREDV